MKRTLALAIATALGTVAGSAAAVVLGPRGTGQVLIYPYYTVRHLQTLLSVVNTTAHGKALKVRFREAYDGREVAGFNLYLGPFDTWVGAVYDLSLDSTGNATTPHAAIGTNDNSCTVPVFGAAPFAGGPPTLAFSNSNYTQGGYGAPTGTDSGPTGLDRTREGFFEIIEMGEVVDQATASQKSLEAITPVNGNPPGCGQVQAAWAANGYWSANAGVDLLPPAGGLYGAAGIVNVAQGTLYSFDATAIDGFSDVAQHTGPVDAKPNLSTAVTDSAHQIATANVSIGNRMVRADYPASRGVDAVSAVLAASDVMNEYITDPQLGAQTEYVVTYPTKQFYVDPAIAGTTADAYVRPFEEVFGGGLQNGHMLDPGEACFDVSYSYHDRDGEAPTGGICLCPDPVSHGNYLCYQSQVITFNQNNVEPGVASSIFGSLLGTNVAANYIAGWSDLSFPDVFVGSGTYVEALRPSSTGQVFPGLPTVGFVAVNYVNANVTPGVLSNYSGAYSLHSTASCINSTNPQSPCE